MRFYGAIRCTEVDAKPLLCFNLHVEKDTYIALGSNLGDRELNLLRAVAEIGKLSIGKVTALSSFYETSPVGVTDQPPFINAVLRLSTVLAPHDLLDCLQHIETAVFSRKRTIRFGPRKMDLDLLLYGDEIINSENLTVPHPRMTERRFVLQPLSDIAPDLMHPVLWKRIAELLRALQSKDVVVKI